MKVERLGICWIMILLFWCQVSHSQDCVYRSPVDGKTILSGSYGEPRTQHFHAGIDYKQQRGIPYDTIRAVADGYISRINVRPDGYGNALYIDHACGQTSVYAHLYVFAPMVRDYIEDIQYKEKKNAIVHKVAPNRLKVLAGDPIGVMGSTGRSSGPHLHFEIRDTKSESSINPALYGFKPQDNIPPVIKGIVIYSLTPDGQELSKQYVSAIPTKNGYRLSTPEISISALTVGIGVHTYDTMNGATNHNGIYSLNLTVDGEGQYRFKLDSLSFETSRYIHAHMDYEAKMTNKYYTKCFQNPGNPLTIYDSRGEAGYISLFEFRSREVEIVVGDVEGNIAQVSFALKRSIDLVNTTQFVPLDDQHLIRVRPKDSLAIDGRYTDITLSPHTVASPTVLVINSDTLGKIDLTQNNQPPIFRYIRVAQVVNRNYPKAKYCFTSIDEKQKTTKYGVQWEGDSVMTAFLPKLIKYDVAVDTIAPTIAMISIPGKGSRCKFKLTDNFEPAYSRDELKWEVVLNSNWILCQHDIKSNTIWFDMPKSMQGGKHELVIKASDSSNNNTIVKRSFSY